jgi:hypothetical protein
MSESFVQVENPGRVAQLTHKTHKAHNALNEQHMD